MSHDWVNDMKRMHFKYDVQPKVDKLSKDELKMFLDFRIRFLEEELNELKDNRDNPEEVVDALIDLSVVAIGTLDLFGIDSYKAWDAVFDANMNKEIGIKPSRPNPLGLPDLIKPAGWVAPSHKGNHGKLTD